MLDTTATKQKFNAWVRSSAFDAQFNAINKRANWPFWAGGIMIVTLVGMIPGIGLIIYGWRRESVRKSARRDAHLAFSDHQPIVCRLVIGNSSLFQSKGAMAPALLVGTFGNQDAAALEDLDAAAFLIGDLYGRDPASVPPEHREACLRVNDDEFQPDRRTAVPAHLFPDRNLWLFDTILLGDHFDSGSGDSPYIPCLVTPGTQGTIAQLPPGVAVFRQPAYDPNIIHYKASSSPPPLVAPVSENLDQIVKHITAHLGEPTRVFHEIISTTVHIDVHIVSATPEKPWISLVTSGMSDLPMNAPDGAEGFRFAELMIRLPADWNLSDEASKQEENYWPIRALKFLARFVHEFETWFCYGHTIPNGNPPTPIAPDLPFTGMILSPPWIDGEFATLELSDGTPVHFWSLIPIHPSEMDFKLKHGADALFERLAAAGYTDLFDSGRPPVA